MQRIIIVILAIALAGAAHAQNSVYEKSDSMRVVQLLADAPALSSTTEYMDYFGHKLTGIPYVAKTLEVGSTEKLVVNMRQIDCTTFTENALALSLCAMNGRSTFRDFMYYLRNIRYKGGKVAYENRLHYFSSWINANSMESIVKEMTSRSSLATAKRALGNSGYMSTHPQYYPQLQRDTSLIRKIKIAEDSLAKRAYAYIPKNQLKNYTLLKKVIKNGDIIAIVTSKAGLDTSHIGIASWHKDGTLHLLNASQIHKKVIDEPMTLYTYMQKHPSQLGIRVIHPM